MSDVGTADESTGIMVVVGAGQDRPGARGGEDSGAGDGGGERGHRGDGGGGKEGGGEVKGYMR